MERLWAPWRVEYILQKPPEGCVFCIGDDTAEDAERFVLYRGKHSFAIMNRYPYVNGHLMAAPYRHTAEPEELSTEEHCDLWETVVLCRSVLRDSLSPQGYNIGMNLGKTAGAGVADHLHIHVVPRWHGDTSFMSVIDDVRVIPESLAAMYDRLLPLFRR
jgi:ATP adenylyltransferase